MLFIRKDRYKTNILNFKNKTNISIPRNLFLFKIITWKAGLFLLCFFRKRLNFSSFRHVDSFCSQIKECSCYGH